MGELLIHHEGGWNIFSTISDGPCWVSALTKDQIRSWYKEKYGSKSMDELHRRMHRAELTGCSSMIGATLSSCIDKYRKVHGKTITDEEFIKEFLTLPPRSTDMGEIVEVDVEDLGTLHERIEKLEVLCAAAYQAAGAYDFPVPWLDALSQAANGEDFCDPLTLLPIVPTWAEELDRLRSSDREVCIAQAVEFAQYVSEAAKGKMVERAQHFLSMPYAKELAARLNLTLTGK